MELLDIPLWKTESTQMTFTDDVKKFGIKFTSKSNQS